MKALIIYDNVTFAMRANFLLRNAAHSANSKTSWDVNLWRGNMLKFQSLAQEALAEALDADLIVFAGPQASLLPRWLKEWLEQWASRRQIKDAALALIEDQGSPIRQASIAVELRDFARRHALDFIASRESRKIGPASLPAEKPADPQNVRAYKRYRWSTLSPSTSLETTIA
ncbi:MAG TPA: hypothetical protein VGN61_09575 [Verrucomicrobiae bacterium]